MARRGRAMRGEHMLGIHQQPRFLATPEQRLIEDRSP